MHARAATRSWKNARRGLAGGSHLNSAQILRNANQTQLGSGLGPNYFRRVTSHIQMSAFSERNFLRYFKSKCPELRKNRQHSRKRFK